jgi:hypothetical protein
MSYAYLASVYYHPDPFERERRYLQAAQATVHLLKLGMWIYSPIVHCHHLSLIADLPKEIDFWLAYDKAMLEKASKLLILRTDRLKQSKGVAAEKAFAEENNIPIEYI